VPRLALRVLAVCSIVLAAACTPKVRIQRMNPAKFELAQGSQLAVQVDADGAPPPAAALVGAALDLAQGQLLNKWVAIEPLRSELDRQLRRTSHPIVERKQAQYLVRAVPTDWQFRPATADGTAAKGSGKLYARIEVLDARDPNAPALYADSYWGAGDGDAGPQGEAEAMNEAIWNLAVRFASDLAPTPSWHVVELDDSDPVVKTGIDLVNREDFDAAYAAFADAVAQKPSSGPALYNLAVMAEERGDYGHAEDLYQRATRILGKPIYYQGLERVRRFQAQAQARAQ
jgi:tetratricopeptide (TPR) repeat protein